MKRRRFLLGAAGGAILADGRVAYGDPSGRALPGGRLHTCAAGSDRPKATFADAAMTIVNPNPVILDARGEASIFWDGAYRIVLADAGGNTIWSADGIGGGDAARMAFLASGAGAVPRDVRSKLRDSVSVFDFMSDVQIDDVRKKTFGHDAAPAIRAAIQAVAERGGGVIWFPQGHYRIDSTITCTAPFIVLMGEGGAVDGNQQFNDTWPRIVSRPATCIRWGGARGGTMLNMQPVDDGKHNALDGNGVVGILFDGAEAAGRGWLFKTLRNARFADASVVRCTVANIDLGVTTQTVFGGNTSLALCIFDNVCASNAHLTRSCGDANPWRMWGDGLVGGVNECEFRNCQAFAASFPAGNCSWRIENTDDNSWYECKWNGSMVLHASDTGAFSLGNSSLAQNHFFYKTLGHIMVLKQARTKGTPSFGHAVYGYSGNLIGPPTVEAGADLSIFGTTIDYAQRSGLMSYGLQPAITNCYATGSALLRNGAVSKIAWSGAQYDRLGGWSASAPTDVVVPSNIKWAEVTAYVSWSENGDGFRYVGVYLAGFPVAEHQVPASGSSPVTLSTGVFPVVPGQVVDTRVMQNSGRSLAFNKTARMTVKWY